MKRTILGLGVVGLLFAGSNASASQYSNAINALGPDAYWRMQESTGTGTDQVGNAHPLDNFNGITRGSAGPSLPGMEVGQKAYLFSGPNGANTNPTPYVPVTGAGARTAIVWAKQTTNVAALGGEQNLCQYGTNLAGTNTFSAFSLGIQQGFNNATGQPLGFDVFALNIQGREVQASTTPIDVGNWHMFAAVFPTGLTTLGDAKLYVDGVPQTLINDLTSVPNTGTNTPLPFRVGQWFGGFGLNGAETELSFFTKGLSASDIQGLYAAATVVPEPAALGLIAVCAVSALKRRR